jgi:hypothetical protein
VVQIFLSISETAKGVQETDDQQVTETFGASFSSKAFRNPLAAKARSHED